MAPVGFAGIFDEQVFSPRSTPEEDGCRMGLDRPGQALHTPLVRVLAAAMIVLAAACGGEPQARSRNLSPPPADSSPSPAMTPSVASPSDVVPRYPNLSRFSDPFDRGVYKSAFSDCSFIGIDGAADAFGGDTDNPRSVAQGYAAATFPRSVAHREPAFQGCLDAFKTNERR